MFGKSTEVVTLPLYRKNAHVDVHKDAIRRRQTLRPHLMPLRIVLGSEKRGVAKCEDSDSDWITWRYYRQRNSVVRLLQVEPIRLT